MTWLVIAGVVIVVGRKYIRPARLGNDILKLEVFRYLHFKNSKDAVGSLSYEDLERKTWVRIVSMNLFVFACLFFGLRQIPHCGMTFSLVISSLLTLASWVISVRRTKVYRTVTLPLFSTLCLIPGSRWRLNSEPRKWVRVDYKKGKVFVRLPKDWHATKPSLKLIHDLVNARCRARWTMKADIGNFILVFSQEKEPETILIPESSEPDVNDVLDFEYTPKETGDENPDDKAW